MQVELGMQGRDRITGFRGVIVGLCQYISGCNQVLLVPAVKPDGELPQGQWLDVQRVEVLPGQKIELDNTETPGPDMPPSRRL